MSLSSASTMAEIENAYDDNASYDLNGSVTECKEFIAACRILLRRKPQDRSIDKMSMGYNLELWQTQLAKAEQWLSINDSTTAAASAHSGSVRHFTMADFRS